MRTKKVKFLSVGHAIMDSRCYLKEFPKLDEMAILLKPITNSCGGSAANFSYNISRMGLEARIASTVGKDTTGKFIIHSLKESKVETSSIRKKLGTSGRAIVLIDKNGNVKVLESIGVSDSYFKPEKRDFRGIKHMHITGINLKLLLSYSKEAKRKGITISSDLGRGKIKLGIKKLNPLLKRIDILLLNRKELSLLTGEKTEGIDEIKERLKELNEKYGFVIAVKGGPKESIAYDGEKFYVRKPIKVKVVDTIGAGDAFDAGFVSLYKHSKNLQLSLQFALKIASLKVQRLGAQALPPKSITRKLFNHFLKRALS